MGRNAVQIPVTNGKVVVQITPRAQISFNFSLKSSFCKKKKKETKNVKTNKLTSTPLIFLNLENRNIIIVLHTKTPKLNDKKNIDIVVKMLQGNNNAPNVISISSK